MHEADTANSLDKIPSAQAARFGMTYAVQYFNRTGPMRGPYMICKGFAQLGWDVEIVTVLSDDNRDIDAAWDCVPVRKVGSGRKRQGLLQLASDMVRRRKDHIAFSWVWDWANYGLLAAKFLWDHPYAVCLDTYMHNAPWDKQDLGSRLRRELRYGLAFRHADIIMAETPAIYENSKRYVPEADVLLVPNCIWRRDVEAIERDWAAEGFGPAREPLILFAGQIIARKGVHDLLAAFAPLASQFPGWKIAILGPCPDPDYIKKLRGILEQTGLEDRVVIEPSLTGDALYRRFRTCAIYCMPTYHEGIPTTILEAMYFGGAIISGRAGFVDYQLDNGDCGMLFTPGDVDALRACLEQLMAAEPLRQHYMERARQRMVNTFVWELYFEAVRSACERRITKASRGLV